MKKNEVTEALAVRMAQRKSERKNKPLTLPADWLKAVDNLDYNERGYVFDVAVNGWYLGVCEKYFKKYLSDTKRAILGALKDGGMLAADRASNLVQMKTFPYAN